MIERRIRAELLQAMDENPAVGLLGPRQTGKTTLALEVAATRPAIYLDLETPSDRAKLSDPEQYLRQHEDKLVILDEVHRAPEIYQTLRGLIDRGRRRGRTGGQFLLLGSASADLLKQSGETLAGRIAYLELCPFDTLEVGGNELNALWVRGGFPSSFLANSERQSLLWREDFIRTYLEREISQFGVRIPPETLLRFWTMLAHNQSMQLNASTLAQGLGVEGKSVARYLDLLVDLLLVRRLPAWHRNVGKRLVKSPKVSVRDSGLCHALLSIGSLDQLLGHPVAGPSWEAFVIESLLAAAPRSTKASFYRTAAGAEVDLVLEVPGEKIWAIEVKRSLAPKLSRGFHQACEDLKADERFVVYPGEEGFPLDADTRCLNVRELARRVQGVDN